MHDPLERTLGVFDLTAVVMGAIIGVGIFFQPGRVANLTGSASLALTAWAIGGIIALTGALTFAELGALFPHTGGQYMILREAYGRLTGFLYCWALLTVIQSGAIAIIGIICIQYLAVGLGLAAPAPVTAQLLAALLIGMLTLVNAVGVRQGAAVTNLTMLFKGGALLLIAAIGLLAAPAAAAVTPAPGHARGDGHWLLLGPALVPVLFSFGGWQQATYIGGEVRDPGRNLPRGIIAGVLLVVALYLAINVGYLSLLGVDRMATTPTLAADAVSAVFPGLARQLTALAVAISALGITNVCLMTSPRMYKAIAEDGAFFAGIARVHPGFKTPARAILLQGGIAVALVLAAGERGVDYLTTGVVCLDWVFFALTGFALFVLRWRRPDAPRPYRAWGYPLLPGIFCVAALGAIVATFMNPETVSASVVAVIVLLTGFVAFAAFTRRGGTTG